MSQKARLQAAFVKALGVPKDAPFDTLAYRQTKGWDSVAHMQLVAEIENEFNVMLDTDDVIGMSSYPVAVSILKKHGIDAHA